MIPQPLLPIANHLWQSTLFAGMASVIALALRKNSARVRHWVWVAASLKFLIPFSVLTAVGSGVEWQIAPAIAPNVSVVVEQVSRPFTLTTVSPPILATAPAAPSKLPEILFGIWACGFIGISISWSIRWRRIAAAVRAGSPVQLGLPIRAISSRSFLEPGVVGVFRPILLLPDGIFEHLTREQFRSVVAHELCHVRHRDNFVATLQTFVETVFWFHPLVWWIGKRILQERETACDEEVLRLGSEPGTYAQSILRVCELYLESPLECLAGVTGSNLKRRIRDIMTQRGTERMKMGKKLLLAAAGMVAIIGPIIVGVLNVPQIQAQSAPAVTPQFEIATIRPARPDTSPSFGVGGGGGGGANVTLKTLIAFAYQLQEYRVLGGPGWISSDRFTIVARAADPATPPERLKLMLQSLFADRFNLSVRREIKESNVYNLVVAKGGPKIKLSADQSPTDISGPAPPGAGPNHGAIRLGAGSMIGNATPLSRFANLLSQRLDRVVIDKTNLTGRFDIRLQWTPDIGENLLSPTGDPLPAEPGDAPSIFVAIQEQLGLKLEAAKGPVEFLLIDHVDKPSEN